MSPKLLKIILHVFLVIFLSYLVFAASKPISGYVNDLSASPVENVNITIYVNQSSLGPANPCYTNPIAVSGVDGSYSTNLANLKRADNDADCSGFWVTGDNIWAEADGSPATPPQGNGTIAVDNITSGTGLQILGNITLAEGPDITSPNVTLIAPVNNTLNTNGSVIFEYNVSDEKNVGNCSLLFDDIVNTTDTSIFVNTTNTFSFTQMSDGIYNWSITCADVSNNVNTTSGWMLNVSKIGGLELDLITPIGNISVEQYGFFEFSVQITCVGGSCGNVNVSLDPILPGSKEKKSWFIKLMDSIINLFTRSSNLLTGAVTGALVPMSPTTPFWTNGLNPTDLTNVSCLGSMADGDQCNVTWYVNASGNIGVSGEFFAYVNSTTYINATNETIHFDISITESINPSVINLTPTIDMVFNVSDEIEIATNATDFSNVSVVFANVTYPNGTIGVLTLTNGSDHEDKYNITFTIPGLINQYLVIFYANDTQGNINQTESTTFNVTDPLAPHVFDLVPLLNESFNTSMLIEIAANVTDDVGISSVVANITLPNGTKEFLILSFVEGDKYNISFTIPELLGTYNVTFVANDTSNNINSTEITFFVGHDSQEPSFLSFVESPLDPVIYSPDQFYEFNVTLDDNIGINNAIIDFDSINYTNISGSGTTFSFNITDLAVGAYSYTWYANDTSGNLNQSTQTYTVNRASSLVNLSVNNVDGNITLESNSTINLIGIRLNGEGEIQLYDNGTRINQGLPSISNLSIFHTLGDVNITVIYPETQNYSMSRETHFITVVDTINPEVKGLVPLENNIFNATNTIMIAVNVTDNVSISKVFANISYPNGTSQELELQFNALNRYNNTFTAPVLIGTYNITFISNDSSGNYNTTEMTNFTVEDILSPSVIDYVPVLNSDFNVTNTIIIALNVTDDVAISRVFANITHPNTTINHLELFFDSNNRYNVTFTAPASIGDYLVTFFVNDSSGNENRSEFTNFTVNDVVNPSVNILTCLPSSGNISNVVECNATITDDVELLTITANVTFPNGTIRVQSVENISSNFNFTFIDTNVPGQYNVSWKSVDTTGNFNSTETTNFTISDVDAPNVTNLNPNFNEYFNVTNIIEVGANVNDDIGVHIVFINISYPNESIKQFTLTNSSSFGNRFNYSFMVPAVIGTYNVTYFGNDTSGNINNSEMSNFTIHDIVNPSVVDYLPLEGTSFNPGELQIQANVTDDVEISQVLANITYPNGTVEVLELIFDVINHYNNTFTAPALAGDYNITFVANDTDGNYNVTETSNFIINDVTNPLVSDDIPLRDSIFNITNTIIIALNVTDDVAISRVFANITHPNTTINHLELFFDSNNRYNVTFTAPASIGDYLVTFFVNDSSGNENRSEFTNFTVNDVVNPSVNILTCLPNSGNISNVVECNATITDDVELLTITANVTFPNATIRVQNVENLGSNFNFTFIDTNMPGQYNISWEVNDTTGNFNSTETTNFTISDVVNPNISSLNPTFNTLYNVTNVIEVGANVTDDVLIHIVYTNISYPNGSIKQFTLVNSSSFQNRYNYSFTIPAIIGDYNIVFFANDSSGNLNDSEITNFTVNDIVNPSVRIVNPLTGMGVLQNSDVLITGIVTDDVGVSSVLANITLPNGSIKQSTLENLAVDDIYNVTFSQTGLAGTYTILMIATDTFGNLNSTVSREFTVQSNEIPFVTLASPTNGLVSSNNTVTFNCNVTDNLQLANISLYHNISGSFVLNETVMISGTENETNWTFNNVLDGKYGWNCEAYDNDTNGMFASSNHTIIIDRTNPIVTNLIPGVDTSYNDTLVIDINATVNDSVEVDIVLANITYPNGTLDQITLLDLDSNHIYNGTFTIPSLNGTYNITYIANDTAGNINATELSNFTVIIGSSSESSGESGNSGSSSGGGGGGGMLPTPLEIIEPVETPTPDDSILTKIKETQKEEKEPISAQELDKPKIPGALVGQASGLGSYFIGIKGVTFALLFSLLFLLFFFLLFRKKKGLYACSTHCLHLKEKKAKKHKFYCPKCHKRMRKEKDGICQLRSKKEKKKRSEKEKRRQIWKRRKKKKRGFIGLISR